jgi:hypothetical protein
MKRNTLAIIQAAHRVLSQHRPCTVRQLYYQLVVLKILPNSVSSYKMVVRALVRGRKEGLIPWDWVEDRLRRPRGAQMWRTPADYLRAVRHSFRADIWEWQPHYVEFWLEKEALAGIFESELSEWGIVLNVGRGYDGWDSIRNAALRFLAWAERRTEIEGSSRTTRWCSVVYFGDFDPSGEDMVRSLRERLAFFGAEPKIVKSAITPQDIEQYRLPPDPTKTTDSRSAAFIGLHGAVSSVELDALPVAVLQERVRREASRRINTAALAMARDMETETQAILDRAIGLAGGDE